MVTPPELVAAVEDALRTRTCDACGVPIHPAHDAHSPCDRGSDPDEHLDHGCQCDNVTHEACCWECNPDPHPSRGRLS